LKSNVEQPRRIYEDMERTFDAPEEEPGQGTKEALLFEAEELSEHPEARRLKTGEP